MDCGGDGGVGFGGSAIECEAVLVVGAVFGPSAGEYSGVASGVGRDAGGVSFFNNEQVTAESVLAPHRQATRERIRQNDVVLVLQDTTELELDRSSEGGFWKLTYESRIGLMDHTRLAITPDGLCLGVTGCDIWARPLVNPHAGTHNRDRAIEDKESLRWLEGYRDANDIAKQSPQMMIVSIADRRVPLAVALDRQC